MLSTVGVMVALVIQFAASAASHDDGKFLSLTSGGWF